MIKKNLQQLDPNGLDWYGRRTNSYSIEFELLITWENDKEIDTRSQRVYSAEDVALPRSNDARVGHRYATSGRFILCVVYFIALSILHCLGP